MNNIIYSLPKSLRDISTELDRNPKLCSHLIGQGDTTSARKLLIKRCRPGELCQRFTERGPKYKTGPLSKSDSFIHRKINLLLFRLDYCICAVSYSYINSLSYHKPTGKIPLKWKHNVKASDFGPFITLLTVTVHVTCLPCGLHLPQ